MGWGIVPNIRLAKVFAETKERLGFDTIESAASAVEEAMGDLGITDPQLSDHDEHRIKTRLDHGWKIDGQSAGLLDPAHVQEIANTLVDVSAALRADPTAANEVEGRLEAALVEVRKMATQATASLHGHA